MAMSGSIRVAVLAVASVMMSAMIAYAQCSLSAPSYSPDFSGANNQACLSLNSTNTNGYQGSPSFRGPQTPQQSVSTVLQLTSPLGGWATSAWFQKPQTVTSGFTTTFAFQIVTPPTNGNIPADGFAFVIQNNPTLNNNSVPYSLSELGPGGCGIGFGGSTSGCASTVTPGIPNSIAIEFNTFNNGGSVDPNSASDVAIQSCPSGGANSVDYASNCNLAINPTAGGVNLTDGNVHVVTVNYATNAQTNCGSSGTQQCYALHVILDGIDLFPNGGVPFDMTKITGGGATATVGYTAATGGDFSEQDIINWIFAPTVTPPPAVVSGNAQTTFMINGGFQAGTGYDFTATQTTNPQTVTMSVTAIPLTQQACNALLQPTNSAFKTAECFVFQNGGGKGQDTSVLFEITCTDNNGAVASCGSSVPFNAILGTNFSFNCVENPNLTCPPAGSDDPTGTVFDLPHLTSADGLPGVGFLKGEGADQTHRHPCTPFADGVTPLFTDNQIESFSLIADTSGGAKGSSGGTTSCWTMTYHTPGVTPSVSVSSPAQAGIYTQNSVVNASVTCSAVSTVGPNSSSPPVGPYLTIDSPTPPYIPLTCGGTDSPGGLVANGSPFDTATLGSHSFTGQVQDSAGNTNQTPMPVTYNVVAAPTVSGPTSAIFTVGVPGSVTFTATGYLPTFTETGALPTGVAFVDNGNGTAILKGTPTATGSFPITITVQNTTTVPGPTATLPFTLTSASSVPTAGTKCNGVYDGTFKGNLTVSAGQSCIFIGGGVTGNVAQTGGTLMLTGATVTGNLQSLGGAFAIGSGTTIKGNVSALNLGKSAAQNTICGATIGGSLQVVASFTPLAIGNGTSCPGNAIGSSLTVTANDAAIAIYGNTVGGSLTDSLNLQPTQVFSNKIKGSLTCTADASITGGGNTASVKTGQCAKF